ncbi:hypothetical protein J7297_02613 [Nakaseomyces glabratus]|nr:hypothetical protein J7296_03979 [Nakaseomyces glabratus]KAH7587339.1 hypothetical protein J7297_02613 [Nakaseomyces glabratus]KAI8392552.1 hypothetical protein J6895_04014 [Nakaseomyces glabratus]
MSTTIISISDFCRKYCISKSAKKAFQVEHSVAVENIEQKTFKLLMKKINESHEECTETNTEFPHPETCLCSDHHEGPLKNDEETLTMAILESMRSDSPETKRAFYLIDSEDTHYLIHSSSPPYKMIRNEWVDLDTNSPSD